MPRPVESLCLCLLLWSGTLRAQEPAPDPELLAFLGEWATDDGGWMDPQSLEQASGLDDDQEATGNGNGHVDAK